MQSRDLRLLMISRDSSLAQKGSPTFLRHLEYAKQIQELHIILLSESGITSPLKQDNLAIYPRIYLPYLFFNLKRLGLNYVTAQDPLISALAGFIFVLFHRLPWQIQVHGDFLGNKYWLSRSAFNIFWQKIALYFFRRADKVRVVSKRVLKSLARLGVDEKKIIILPIYTELTEVEYRKKEKIILYAGRLEWEKNVAWLVRSWAKLADKFKDWRLVIVGEGSLKNHLKEMSRELGIENRVEWFFWQNDLSKFYGEAGIFILPSFFEGWGRSVIEALNYGCAVIMSDVGLAQETVRNQENGLIVYPDDEDSLRQGMERLMNDEQYRSALGVVGKKSLEKLLTKEEYLKQWGNLF